MVTVFHINDSRAFSRVAIGARDKETKQMEQLIDTALFKARAASDRAESHMDFADMFHVAGFHALAQSRKAASVSESRMAEIYYAMASELAV